MNVLVVLSSNARRGAELQGSSLVGELVRRGVDARLTALRAAPGRRPLDVEVLGRSARSMSTIAKLRRLAATADIVVAFGSTTLPACAVALAGSATPFVYRNIGDPSAWVRSDLHRMRTGMLMRRASAVAALWPGAAHAMTDLYRVERVIDIPNARMAGEFRPPSGAERTEARTRFGLETDARVVAWVGSFSPEKRPQLAIDVIERLEAVHLLMVGDGAERIRTEQAAVAARHGRVAFTGEMDDVRQVYAAADLLLLTSSTEGMPGVMIEAALSGLATVATGVGAVPWMFDRGLRGEMVPADARDDRLADLLVSAVSEQLAIPRTVPPAGGVEWCTWPTVAEQWIEMLRSVVEGREIAA